MVRLYPMFTLSRTYGHKNPAIDDWEFSGERSLGKSDRSPEAGRRDPPPPEAEGPGQ